MLDNEAQLLTVDSLLKNFSKASKAANEAGEASSKAVRATAGCIESLGKFEARGGEDSNGIIGRERCIKNYGLYSFPSFSSVIYNFKINRT